MVLPREADGDIFSRMTINDWNQKKMASGKAELYGSREDRSGKKWTE
jgi:hypothetical protein